MWSARIRDPPSRKSLLGEAANGPIFRVIATITVIVVGLMAAGALITDLPSLLGLS